MHSSTPERSLGLDAEGVSSVAPSALRKLSKSWGAWVALVTATLVFVDVGIRIEESMQARDDRYASAREMSEVKSDIKEIKGDVKTLTKQALEIRIADLKPMAEQASLNSVDAIDRVGRVERKVEIIHASIEGANRSASRHGQITPLPLQGYEAVK